MMSLTGMRNPANKKPENQHPMNMAAPTFREMTAAVAERPNQLVERVPYFQVPKAPR